MDGFGESDDHRPVTWLRGHPIYAAHFIVLVFVASMLGTTALKFARAESVLLLLPFSSEAVLKGEVWRVFTYGLWNEPSLWFVVDMFMIVWFGRELEKFFGRQKFLLFYGCLYFLSPLLFTLIGVWRPMGLQGETGAFAVFIAFATLYPNAVLIFNLLAKWVALILVGLYTLIALSNRDLVGLITLGTTVSFAFAFVRYQQGRFAIPRFRLPGRKPRLRVLPDDDAVPHDESMAEIDALLDKIARSGIASLTSKERTRLETARADLLKKESRRSKPAR